MKSILEYANDYFFDKQMINEAFNSKILQEISKQFNDTIKANKEYNKEKNWRSRQTSNNFKKLLGSNSIAWDKITDDMFDEYEKNEESIDLVSKMVSSTKKSFPGLVILLNTNENIEEKYIGALIHLYSGPEATYISFNSEYGWSTQVRRKDVESLLTNKFLVVNIKDVMTVDLTSERNKQKLGAINIFNDDTIRDNYYKEVAEKNRERYRRYLAKVKAEKDANDEIPGKVQEYVNKILNVTTKLSTNPVKYAKYEYEVKYLLDYLNETRRWNSDTKRGGYYTGKDGLLTLFKSYISTKLSLAKGDSYDNERKSYELYKKMINNIFSDIDNYLQKFEDVE